jgi:hypothetical protein
MDKNSECVVLNAPYTAKDANKINDKYDRCLLNLVGIEKRYGIENPKIKIDKTTKILNNEYKPSLCKYGKANVIIIKCPTTTITTG